MGDGPAVEGDPARGVAGVMYPDRLTSAEIPVDGPLPQTEKDR